MAGGVLKTGIGLAAAIILFWGAVEAPCETKLKAAIDRDQPIQIVSDRLDAYHEKRMVVFTGNAVATQGQRTIRSDRLALYYREDRENPGKAKAGVEGTGNLDKVEATGHVTITEGERIVTGDQAVFDQEAQKITMTGNAMMREGANIVRGDRIIVFLTENRGVVDSTENKRVTATIYPGEPRDKKR